VKLLWRVWWDLAWMTAQDGLDSNWRWLLYMTLTPFIHYESGGD